MRLFGHAFGGRPLAKLPGYDAVTRRDEGRDAPGVETKCEDDITKGRNRSLLVASQRDAFRNTTFSPATALQLQVNVVGVEGGKLTVVTDDGRFNEDAAAHFRRWAKSCGFTEGLCLNEILRLLLIQLTHNGGDFIVVCDDGCITGGKGTGKIRVFESDEIKNIDAGEFDRLYPGTVEGTDVRLHTQRNGIVYDRFGRIEAAFVSTSGRKRQTFEPGTFITLTLPEPGDFTLSPWLFVANRWRVNQGRGVSTATHVTNLLADLAATQGSEVQAAKINSALGMVVSDASPEDLAAASHFSPGASDEVAEGGGGADGGAPLEDAESAEDEAFRQASVRLLEGGAAVVKLAANKKLESFKTERPNLGTVEFIHAQRTEAGTVFGLPPAFVTLEPAGSYTAFRGSLQMAERAFSVLRKKLERDVLDPLAAFVLSRSGLACPEGFEDCLVWSWPKMIEVDEGSYQTALEKKFTNGCATYQGEYGASWRKIVDQQALEKEYAASRGLTYPADRTASGGTVPQAGDGTPADKRDHDEIAQQQAQSAWDEIMEGKGE